jgi:hypothetical protein
MLTAMNSPKRKYSPNQLAEEMRIPLGTVSYHMRELAALRMVEPVGTEQRRGAIEHFYRATQRAGAWAAVWENMPPAGKQAVAATALEQGVLAVGASIDNGRFHSRDDSALAQDTFRADEKGAEEVLEILRKTVHALIAAAERSEARLAEAEEDGTPISYLLAGFEGVIRPA